MLRQQVHLLHESRGAVLEVVVSRMRTTARASPVRVVALSATVGAFTLDRREDIN